MESILQSKEKEEGKGGDDKITTLGNKDTNIQEIDMTNDESIQINSSSYNDQLANNELSLVIKWKKVDEYALTLDQVITFFMNILTCLYLVDKLLNYHV